MGVILNPYGEPRRGRHEEGWIMWSEQGIGLTRGVGVGRRDLVGLYDAVGWTVYIQDIIVAPTCQRMGLGRALVLDCLERYAHVRQLVLLTDDRPEQLAFYASLGFSNTRELVVTRLNAFVRIAGIDLS